MGTPRPYTLAELRPGDLVRREELLCRHAFDRLVRDRRLIPLTEDVARQPSKPSSIALRAAALATECPDLAVIGSTSATWILHPRLGAQLSGLMPADVTVEHRKELHRGPVTCFYDAPQTRPRNSQLHGFQLRRTRFAPGDIRPISTTNGDRVLVTSPQRTVLDLVCDIEGTSVLSALRTFAHDGVDLHEVLQRLHSLRRWNGRQRGIEMIETYLHWNDA